MSKNYEHRRHSTAESVANTFEWLITAFILAFVFRAFVLEAFRIPTGSMADTLMGDHLSIRCTQCGYKYEFNFDPEMHQRYRTAVGGGKFRLVPNPRCPSCGYYENTNNAIRKSNGDRILVFKCLYQFSEPKRWDAIVFKNPTDPAVNYIKRLIAKPGETVEIIDGDIYINGMLARKPKAIQKEMWMPIYNNDYQPIAPNKGSMFNGHAWHQPFVNDEASKWSSNPASPTIFTLDSKPKQTNIMFYDTKKGNNFRASYAYGNPQHYSRLPICSDLMMEFYVTSDSPGSQIGIGLSKYETLYKGYVSADSRLIIEKVFAGGKTTELAAMPSNATLTGRPIKMRFANVDHQLVLEFGNEKLIHDMGLDKNDAGTRIEIEPKAIIFGSGKLSISHAGLYRDIHYLSSRYDTGRQVARAGEGNPFTLDEDEFFALGDNSPDSSDSRMWAVAGLGNNEHKYRMGIVPREYLVGKAFFVYWPSGYTAEKLKLPLIPNIGRMRLIHGGLK